MTRCSKSGCRHVARLRAKKADAVEAAWKALAGYKFWMFGYHAARWVQLNQLDDHKEPNPFRHLVEAAKEQRKENER